MHIHIFKSNLQCFLCLKTSFTEKNLHIVLLFILIDWVYVECFICEIYRLKIMLIVACARNFLTIIPLIFVFLPINWVFFPSKSESLDSYPLAVHKTDIKLPMIPHTMTISYNESSPAGVLVFLVSLQNERFEQTTNLTRQKRNLHSVIRMDKELPPVQSSYFHK